MAVHPYIDQLRFARQEFARCLEGVSPEDAKKRLGPMNSMGWIVGHLANQEHRYWVVMAQGQDIAPGLDAQVGTGRPASTPDIDAMWAIWQRVTKAADRYFDSLTPQMLETYFDVDGQPASYNVARMLLRNTYHYWFHTGEACAIRQVLGHPAVPEFVGDMHLLPYRVEPHE